MKKKPTDKKGFDIIFKHFILFLALCFLLGLYSYRHYFSVGRSHRIQPEAVSVVLNSTVMTADEKILYDLPLDINKATPEELMKISGIGPTLSTAIVAYRDKNGPFSHIEELTQIKGIGERKFRKIKKYVAVTVVSTPK